jgi:hypothetical protein
MSQSYIGQYASSRKNIHSWLDSEGIPRNDNIVGRIGEYQAKEYMINTHNPNAVITWPTKSNSTWDFEINSKRYSVKVITSENTSGRTSPVKFNREWHELIAIRLDDTLGITKLSVINYDEVFTYATLVSINYRRNNQLPSSVPFQWWSVLDDPRYKKI